MSYLRGQLAKAAHVNAETLRYYEKNGLIPIPQRTEGDYRLYPDDTLERLQFIKQAKGSGLTLDEIRGLLQVFDGKTIDEAFITRLIDRKIKDMDNKIADYSRMKEILAAVRNNLDQPKCPVIKSMLKKARQTNELRKSD